MLKQISKIKTIILEILEKELITVLALSMVMLGIWLVKADTDSTELSFVILDSGTVTVTAPNGSEDWQVDSTQHITWDSTGSINSVKIELQRETDGSWETLIASTTNDGDYPWLVTSPTTATATMRITSTTVPEITDSSDVVFTISAAPEASSGLGGYLPTYPAIDSVSPMSFYYDDAVELLIRGFGFEDRVWVTINQVTFPVQKPHSQNLMLINLQPNTLTVGTYRLCAYNTLRQYDCYSRLITVTDRTKITPPTTGGTGEEYAATLIRQFSLKPADGAPLQTGQKLTGQSPDIALKARETATLWAEFKNTGTATWYQDGSNPVRLGTDNKRDRRSPFYHSSWIKFNRPTLVNKVVKPGEIGRFEFAVKAPWRTGNYVEYFRPVAEWKIWMNGDSQVRWVIAVKSKPLAEWFKKPAQAAPLSTPLIKPTIPSTGGTIELPFQPKDTLVFTDNIERIYQKTIQTITGFFSSLLK
ncbi:TPA: hypothetical protein DIV45_00395 [Patescibacteria group bacterium]|uniref:Next to BRCA1 central domain-containing protein n=2 Tax=Bacteria division Kazan-3B-28 TaxID=1798534 RepID=A0A0G1N202_UNCK3|nr:MAG: hypothetical protein VE96_C0010G0004 [candidate division Kazan bacterium GW2011_GWA1_44_22]KKT87087.1 MAG: hypothetical protein VE97_C0006G0008 [candidate division Kazan bacterium GW2011_GWB1_45_10]HCR41825.1 hypothetical protein [Patescibacteria group bacterium]